MLSDCYLQVNVYKFIQKRFSVDMFSTLNLYLECSIDNYKCLHTSYLKYKLFRFKIKHQFHNCNTKLLYYKKKSAYIPYIAQAKKKKLYYSNFVLPYLSPYNTPPRISFNSDDVNFDVIISFPIFSSYYKFNCYY